MYQTTTYPIVDIYNGSNGFAQSLLTAISGLQSTLNGILEALTDTLTVEVDGSVGVVNYDAIPLEVVGI
jgi:hypothetical protein